MVDAGNELSRFFGREHERELIDRQFAEGRRMVVLVGAPGAGKSRLARQVARGSVFVRLGGASTLEELVGRTAEALESTIHETRDVSQARQRIAEELERRGDALVVFDRADQCAQALAETAVQWASAAPNARFLITSRARLALPGAAEIVLDGLPADAAAELFVDRARLQQPSWQPDAAERAAIAELVRRLGGLPLAIELAAGRSSLLGVHELVRQLERKSGVTRALFESIEESWSSLSAAERALSNACAAFAGNFSLDAAEAVLWPLMEGIAVVDALQELANKSILRRAGGSARLGMLEPVRAYAAEQLAKQPELERRIRNLHAEYFAELAVRARHEYLESGDRGSLEELALERDNLSAAFEWCVADEHDPDRAAELALALHTLLWVRGPIGLHLALLERALSGTERAAAEGRVDLLLAQSTALGHGVGRERALGAAERALQVAREAEHRQRQARALARIARVHASYGEPAAAIEHARAALQAAEQSGDALGEAYACSTLASAHRQLGELERARTFVVQALGLLRTVRRPRLELESLELLAAIERAQGRHERALAVLEDALAGCERIDDERMIANVSCELGALREGAGEPQRALRDYERAEAALARLGSRHEELGARLSAIAVALELSDDAAAGPECEQALALARKLGDRSAQALAAALLGVADSRAARLGHAERAFELAESIAADAGPELGAAVAIHRGHLDIARSDHAAARERLTSASGWSDRVSQARRMLEHALERAERVSLTVAEDGSWFELSGCGRVSIAHRRSLCRLLALLALERSERPGLPIGYAPITEVMWPGERILASAAKSRIHVAVSTLRKLGLGELVRGGSEGYHLDPTCELSRKPAI